MDEIYVVEGEDLQMLLEELGSPLAGSGPGGIYRLRFAIDGGLKVKVNNDMWSPPLGGEE